MKNSLKLLILFFYSSVSYSNPLTNDYIAVSKQRCALPYKNKSYITNKDFSWHLSLLELINLSKSLYHSNKSLYNKAYYDSSQKSFMLPVHVALNTTKNIKLSENFILNLISHIETALEKNYADEINYADMGHSHFLIPKNYYKEKVGSTKINKDEEYHNILKSPKTLFVYHTAEQLNIANKLGGRYHLPENDYLKHRYLTRNIIGYNNGSKQLDVVPMESLTNYNTFEIRDIRSSKYNEYKWYGAGYYMSANYQGCFPFLKNGILYYFDLSLEGPDSSHVNDRESQN